MQMTHSVGQTIGRLSHDCGISCAEPWRVPAAGRVDLCLFDKTGTLTSDQLDACLCVWMGGEVTLQPQGPIAGDVESQPPLEAQLVLAGCQSLVEVEGELIGDPMEISAVKTVGWALNASSSDTSVLAPANSTTASSSRIDIWHRHGFDPDLQRYEHNCFLLTLLYQSMCSPKISYRAVCSGNSQPHRMSVIAEVYTGPQNSSGIWCLTKGSPESIKSLLDPSHIPEWYDSKHREMTEGGQRVIALAYRPPSNFSQAGGMTKSLSRSLTRGECEQRGSMR
jgi:cation-transporting ATPase 13A1